MSWQTWIRKGLLLKELWRELKKRPWAREHWCFFHPLQCPISRYHKDLIIFLVEWSVVFWCDELSINLTSFSPWKLTAFEPKMKVDASDDFPSQRGDGFRFFLPFIFQGVIGFKKQVQVQTLRKKLSERWEWCFFEVQRKLNKIRGSWSNYLGKL